MTQAKQVVFLASGGTGGHIFPAQALAAELQKRGYEPVIITDTRYDNYAGNGGTYEVLTIPTSGLMHGLTGKFKGLINMGRGYMAAKRLIRRYKPVAAVGFGGYPSMPTMMAAVRNSNVKTVIHEQNSLLGRSNYFLASRVDAIATSFQEVKGLDERLQQKVSYTGNPVRPNILALRTLDYPAFDEYTPLRLLVTGGSQGAQVLGDVIPEAIGLLDEEKRQRIRIDQQCRKENIDRVRKRYQELGVSADVATFFNDMPSRLASCHLFIGRAGASTIAELSVIGRPAIFVPYPYATDDHQTVNATLLEDAGGAWVMPQESFTPANLKDKLEHFFMLPESLTGAASHMRKAGRPHAAEKLADMVMSLTQA